MATSVLVSGATGFIAQHIIKLLLSKGYNVVGTVRTVEKGDNLTKLFNSPNFTYGVVSSLTTPGAFDDVVKNHPEVTVFMRTASPVSFNLSDLENDMLIPSVEGTKNALNAIQKYGQQMKHVVVTSSLMASVSVAQISDPSIKITEDSTSPVTWEEAKANPVNAYFGAKKFAENAAWDFYNQEKPSYSLNVVRPIIVFGPQAFDSEVKGELNGSAEIINQFLKLNPDSKLPEEKGGFIDVRDVAKAHVAAFENGFNGKRLLMHSEMFSAQKILNILNSHFDELKGKLPTGSPSGNEEPTVAEIDNSQTRELLHFPLVDLRTSVVDSVEQILKANARASR